MRCGPRVISHMCSCPRGAWLYCTLAQLLPLRAGERAALRGDRYTGGTLSAATQTQPGTIPAVKRGLYWCMCATLREKKNKKVLPSREALPSGRRVITREHVADKKY